MAIDFVRRLILSAILGAYVFLPFAQAQTSAADNGAQKLEITKFRFSAKNKKGYERLVLEFAPRENGALKPVVKLTAHLDQKEASIILEHTALLGAIPEAMINDSYAPRSRFLGPININADDPAGLAIRISLKNPVKDVQAFWVDNPARLVMDVYPDKRARSEKSSKPQRTTASLKNGAESSILCFPATSQVGASVIFHNKEAEKLTPKLPDSTSATVGPEDVVCYPAAAQMEVSIGFLPKNTLPLNPAAPLPLTEPPHADNGAPGTITIPSSRNEPSPLQIPNAVTTDPLADRTPSSATPPSIPVSDPLVAATPTVPVTLPPDLPPVVVPPAVPPIAVPSAANMAPGAGAPPIEIDPFKN